MKKNLFCIYLQFYFFWLLGTKNLSEILSERETIAQIMQVKYLH